MKTLCLYYTRTNTTKAAMDRLAELLDADIAEYTDGKDRSGALGYVGACFASMKKTFPEIQIPKDIQLDSYDRVLIGMPIWVEGPLRHGKGSAQPVQRQPAQGCLLCGNPDGRCRLCVQNQKAG